MVMGFDITILSMVSLLGLSGILVNDSIIMVTTIDQRRAAGEAPLEAIIGGSVDRLRAVLLTSLTTIGGLTPLLFETSIQAQFLQPMAVTLVFGLMITTFLVLFVVPALLAVQEDVAWLWRRARARPEPAAA
jgi:multidrug efflux pump subunit AcrB